MTSATSLVYSDGKTIHIAFPSKIQTYQINHNRLTDNDQLQYWVNWLTPKKWVTTSHIEQFKTVVINEWNK